MIKFSKIESGDIFTRDFRPLVKNNDICFSDNEGIAVIYGPNGTGKTSLIKVLSGASGTKVDFEYDGQQHTTGQSVFHIINDQNSRNIIAGEAKDFLLGDNIKKEFELQDFIIQERLRVINSAISMLKKDYGISTVGNPLVALIGTPEIEDLVKDLANNKSKGNKFSTEGFINVINSIHEEPLPEYDAEKLIYFKEKYADKESIIWKIENIDSPSLSPNPHIREIEENTEAINILNRFHKDQCIVCDTNGIDRERLLESKTKNRSTVIEALDESVRAIIENIVSIAPDQDPFAIKEHLLEALNSGDKAIVNDLNAEFTFYKDIIKKLILNALITLLAASELANKYREYESILAEKPEISDEDLLYIEEIISNSMNKSLSLERDEQKNLKIRLSNQDFLGKTREDLPLSTGEQNFLSLTFEFLKAKNSTCPIVIIDDPVSSFDSIYKNKVVYAIVKMLHNKKRIILTHNIDLLRLLESQYSSCYKMYLLNNTDGEENGFIALKSKEQEMLINLKKLLDAFRDNIFDCINNVELFLISMIPFMRGYANIINKNDIYRDLTQLLHGYNTEKVDIAVAYKKLFGTINQKIPVSYEVSVSDILSKTVDGIHILDHTEYPLLDKTLRHSFTYLFLRLMVEKNLVNRFSINTSKNRLLGQIISAAFPNENDIAEMRNRIRLTSKKTLINEFNHFEGNLSIFQPAIDITDHALGSERTDIVSFINAL